jgi:translocator protein
LRKFLPLLGFLLLCWGVAALGGWATSQSVTTWYPEINKPGWNPPSYVFGPVWTILYTLMAVAAWLIWQRGPQARGALVPFVIQLALNLAWSFVFFSMQSPGIAVIDILALWIAIAWTMRAFDNHSRTAAVLLMPYWAWVTFAAALNIAIWQLN